MRGETGKRPIRLDRIFEKYYIKHELNPMSNHGGEIYQSRKGVFHPSSIIRYSRPRSYLSNTSGSVSSDIQTPRSDISDTGRSV